MVVTPGGGALNLGSPAAQQHCRVESQAEEEEEEPPSTEPRTSPVAASPECVPIAEDSLGFGVDPRLVGTSKLHPKQRLRQRVLPLPASRPRREQHCREGERAAGRPVAPWVGPEAEEAEWVQPHVRPPDGQPAQLPFQRAQWLQQRVLHVAADGPHQKQ